MSARTLNFVGPRLTEAREARGINQTVLAEILGVSRQAISQYEKNQRSPSQEVLAHITKVLRIPTHFFFKPNTANAIGTVFFRSMSAATKAARTRAKRRHDWLKNIVAYLHQFVEFPAVTFPDFDLPTNPNMITFDKIEDIASQTRRFWGLGNGHISNIVRLIENNGGIVVRQEMVARTLDAFSEWSIEHARPSFVLGTDKASAVRSRFDAAHELAHMVLHRKMKRKDVNHSSFFKLVEKQAHYFAGAFLLPAETFSEEIFSPRLDSFVALKAKWRVSIGAMIKRARHLNLISRHREQRLFANRSRRRWATKEPLDDEIEPEQPQLLRRAFDLLMENELLTQEDLESSLAIFVSDIESVTGLPSSYFINDTRRLRFPRITPSTESPRTTPKDSATIYFPSKS